MDEDVAVRFAVNDTVLTALLVKHLAQQPDPDEAAQAILQICDDLILEAESRVQTDQPHRDMRAFALFQRFLKEKIENAAALAAPPKPDPER